MRNGPPLEMWGAKPPSIKRRGKVILPARGASRSSAPTLIYTSCDGTILAGVFKYSDAIKYPDGNTFITKNYIRTKIKKGLPFFKKKNFLPKNPKKPQNPPPPQITAVLYQ